MPRTTDKANRYGQLSMYYPIRARERERERESEGIRWQINPTMRPVEFLSLFACFVFRHWALLSREMFRLFNSLHPLPSMLCSFVYQRVCSVLLFYSFPYPIPAWLFFKLVYLHCPIERNLDRYQIELNWIIPLENFHVITVNSIRIGDHATKV